jgi:hypothetical protein
MAYPIVFTEPRLKGSPVSDENAYRRVGILQQRHPLRSRVLRAFLEYLHEVQKRRSTPPHPHALPCIFVGLFHRGVRGINRCYELILRGHEIQRFSVFHVQGSSRTGCVVIQTVRVDLGGHRISAGECAHDFPRVAVLGSEPEIHRNGPRQARIVRSRQWRSDFPRRDRG